jgi:tetratricopeptide (TPR) repeat protein
MVFWCKKCELFIRPVMAQEKIACPHCLGSDVVEKEDREAVAWLLSSLDRSYRHITDSIEQESIGDIEKAYELSDMAVKDMPGLADAYARREWMALQMDDYRERLDQVIEDCGRVLEQQPDNAYVLNDLGRAYDRKNDREKARAIYRRVLEIEPSMTIAALNLMSLEVRSKRFAEARDIYAAWEGRIQSPAYALISSYLQCTALALDGKEYMQYYAPLLDDRIAIGSTATWNNDNIDSFIRSLEDEGYYPERLKVAKRHRELFKEHYCLPG